MRRRCCPRFTSVSFAPSTSRSTNFIPQVWCCSSITTLNRKVLLSRRFTASAASACNIRATPNISTTTTQQQPSTPSFTPSTAPEPSYLRSLQYLREMLRIEYGIVCPDIIQPLIERPAADAPPQGSANVTFRCSDDASPSRHKKPDDPFPENRVVAVCDGSFCTDGRGSIGVFCSGTSFKGDEFQKKKPPPFTKEISLRYSNRHANSSLEAELLSILCGLWVVPIHLPLLIINDASYAVRTLEGFWKHGDAYWRDDPRSRVTPSGVDVSEKHITPILVECVRVLRDRTVVGVPTRLLALHHQFCESAHNLASRARDAPAPPALLAMESPDVFAAGASLSSSSSSSSSVAPWWRPRESTATRWGQPHHHDDAKRRTRIDELRFPAADGASAANTGIRIHQAVEEDGDKSPPAAAEKSPTAPLAETASFSSPAPSPVGQGAGSQEPPPLTRVEALLLKAAPPEPVHSPSHAIEVTASTTTSDDHCTWGARNEISNWADHTAFYLLSSAQKAWSTNVIKKTEIPQTGAATPNADVKAHQTRQHLVYNSLPRDNIVVATDAKWVVQQPEELTNNSSNNNNIKLACITIRIYCMRKFENFDESYDPCSFHLLRSVRRYLWTTKASTARYAAVALGIAEATPLNVVDHDDEPQNTTNRVESKEEHSSSKDGGDGDCATATPTSSLRIGAMMKMAPCSSSSLVVVMNNSFVVETLNQHLSPLLEAASPQANATLKKRRENFSAASSSCAIRRVERAIREFRRKRRGGERRRKHASSSSSSSTAGWCCCSIVGEQFVNSLPEPFRSQVVGGSTSDR